MLVEVKNFRINCYSLNNALLWIPFSKTYNTTIQYTLHYSIEIMHLLRSAVRSTLSPMYSSVSSIDMDFMKRAKGIVDFDSDGHISMQEIIKSSIIKNCREALKAMCPGGHQKRDYALLLQYLWNLVPPRDLIIMALLVLFHKSLLKFLYGIRNKIFGTDRPYTKSLFGFIEIPVTYFVWSLPFFYAVDMVSIFLQYLGVDHNLMAKICQIITTVTSWLLIGSLLTRLKDWLAWKRRHTSVTVHRDEVKDQLTDDITSCFIWFFIVGFTIESLALPLKVISKYLT